MTNKNVCRTYDRPTISPNNNDSLSKIAAHITPGSVVLDVGCGIGRLGEFLTKEKQCKVDGIEYHQTSADIARPHYRTLWVFDIESHSAEQLTAYKYDFIVCADILEHLRYPEQIIKSLSRLLAVNGRFLISIPNISYIGVVAELLLGEFKYRDDGILDKTHLHFYTQRSFHRLLSDCGLYGRAIDRTTVDLQISEFNYVSDSFFIPQNMRFIGNNQTYQFIFEAFLANDIINDELEDYKYNFNCFQPEFFIQGNSLNKQLAELRAVIDHKEKELNALQIELNRPLYRVARLQKQVAQSIPGLLQATKLLYNYIKKHRSINLPQKPDLVADFLNVLRSSNNTTYSNASAWYNSDSPEVSIIILNWNKGSLTSQCLHEIWKHTTDVTYEIIVIDNGSCPTDLLTLSSLTGPFSLIRLEINRLFGEGNNIASEFAKGDHLLFLNNDAFVTDNWLKPLVDSVRTSLVGAAGPLFLYPDGRVQEAGSFIDINGDPKQRGKNLQTTIPELEQPREVHYISAACLLVKKELFFYLNGFSLDFEPAYYEDVDLCFRIRKLGYKIQFTPQTKIFHIENYSHKEIGITMSHSIVINRRRLVDRHNDIIGIDSIPISPKPLSSVKKPSITNAMAIVGLYTPFSLTPGGGERYLLTIASLLSINNNVVIITQELYSYARLRQLGEAFDLDLSKVILKNFSSALAIKFDYFISMGNKLTPDVPALAEKSIFLCQFPFPSNMANIIKDYSLCHNYKKYITYSEYSKKHILMMFDEFGLPSKNVKVIYPACPQITSNCKKQQDKTIILSVGRFFRGGHCKNHHLLVHAFRKLISKHKDIELHLAGSIHPEPEHIDYFKDLEILSRDLPIVLHANPSNEKLASLYKMAHIYWHGTGMDKDPQIHPEAMEHFGISIVEAMSAGCVPLAFHCGGPSEIISENTDGYLYNTEEDLIKLTIALARNPKEMTRLSENAISKASNFSVANFSRLINGLLGED